jgi:hypothetical protein
MKGRGDTWLRTSESEAEATNVIARPLVPNRPALPTCKIKEPKILIIWTLKRPEYP